jgi:hypothetical protein
MRLETTFRHTCRLIVVSSLYNIVYQVYVSKFVKGNSVERYVLSERQVE